MAATVSHSQAPASSDALASHVRDAWRRVFNCETVEADADFFVLGGDSLAATELSILLEKATGLPFPAAALQIHSTPEKLTRFLETRPRNHHIPFLTPVRGPVEDKKAPVLIIICPRKGGALHYRFVVEALPENVAVWAIDNHLSLTGETPFSSIQQIAENVAPLIDSHFPQPTLHLTGFSFAGKVAYETAVELQNRGRRVGLLAIGDTPVTPAGDHPNNTEATAHIRSRYRRLQKRFELSRGIYERIGLIPPRFLLLRFVLQMLTGKQQTETTLSEFEPDPEDKLRLQTQAPLAPTSTLKLGKNYAPRPYHGELTLFVATHKQNPLFLFDPAIGWTSHICQQLHYHALPGDHFQLLHPPNSETIARVFTESLQIKKSETAPVAGRSTLLTLEPLADFDLNKRFHQRVLECAAAYPNHPACIGESGEITTYRQLIETAYGIAEALSASNQTGLRVLSFSETPRSYAAGLLACSMTGNIFCPVNTDIPIRRIQNIIESIEPAFLLTSVESVERILPLKPPASQLIRADHVSATSFTHHQDTAPEAPLCLLHTSGSTGVPKGVVLSHRAINSNSRNRALHYELSYTDHYASLYGFGVMGNLHGFGAALFAGATLLRYNLKKSGIPGLRDWLAARQIQVLHTIPTVFRRLTALQSNPLELPKLRALILGGEPTTRSDVTVFNRSFPQQVILHTGLGSSETGSIALNTLRHGEHSPTARAPAGRICDGITVHILDHAGQPVAPGEEGEICIESDQLFSGYWKQDTPRLIPSPTGKKRFLSGDLGKLLPDGRLLHIGRKDHVVKVRGYRIETGEVEAALLEVEGITEAAVVAILRPDDSYSLSAFVRLHEEISLTAGGIRIQLINTLPEYMIPAQISIVDSLPVNQAGKLDREQLRKQASQ